MSFNSLAKGRNEKCRLGLLEQENILLSRRRIVLTTLTVNVICTDHFNMRDFSGKNSFWPVLFLEDNTKVAEGIVANPQ